MKIKGYKTAIAYLSLITFVAIYFLIPYGMNKSVVTSFLCVAAISTAVFFISEKQYATSRNWASLTGLFVIGYCIVHLQLPLLYALGFDVSNSQFWFIWADERIVNKAVAISTFGLLSFYIGSYTTNRHSQKIKNKRVKESSSIFFLLPVVYASYIAYFLSSGSYSSGAYSVGDSANYASYLYLIFNTALLSAIIIRLFLISSVSSSDMTLRAYLGYFGAPLILIIVWHVAFSFYVGDRGPVITYCLLCSSIYFYRFNRVSLTRAIVYLVAVSSIMVFVKDVRTKDTNTSYSERASVAINGVETNSKFDGLIIPGSTFIELAYSGRAVNHAIENVPGKYPFTYGYYLLFNTVAIVPGLAGIFWELFSDSEAKYNSSSGFITYLIQGDNPLYGDGTSVVADLYLDFGVYGVIIGLFIFGKFVTKFEQQLYAGQVNSILLWIAALIFLSVAIYIGRSSISIQFQKIFLVFFFIKINSGISFYYAKKK